MPSKIKEPRPETIFIPGKLTWLNDYGHPTGLIDWAREHLKINQRATGYYEKEGHLFHFTIKREPLRHKHQFSWSVVKNMRPFLKGCEFAYESFSSITATMNGLFELHWDETVGRWLWLDVYRIARRYRGGSEIPASAETFVERCGNEFYDRFRCADPVVKDRDSKVAFRRLVKRYEQSIQKSLDMFDIVSIDDDVVRRFLKAQAFIDGRHTIKTMADLEKTQKKLSTIMEGR